MQYVSKRRTLADQTAPACWLANLTLLSKVLAKGLDLSADVYTLFDENYGEPGARLCALEEARWPAACDGFWQAG